jgi:hypothetical protein
MLQRVIRSGACLALVSALVIACGSESTQEDASTTVEVKPVPEITRLDDTTDALEDQFKRLVANIKAGEYDLAETILKGYALPDAPKWFKDHFGDALGVELASGYEAQGRALPQLAKLIRSLTDKGLSLVTVERFEASSSPDAVGYQALALDKMRKKVALYSVRLSQDKDKDAFHLWSFMHDGTTFRWVGKMREVSGKDAPTPDPLELRQRLAKLLAPKK